MQNFNDASDRATATSRTHLVDDGDGQNRRGLPRQDRVQQSDQDNQDEVRVVADCRSGSDDNDSYGCHGGCDGKPEKCDLLVTQGRLKDPIEAVLQSNI